MPGSPRLIAGSPPVSVPAVGPVTVTDFLESPRQPGRYRVVLSDGRRLAVGIAALADLGITRKGIELTPIALARLEREAAIATVHARALASLARARRTRRELELRLRRIEPDRSIIAEALDRLAGRGFLDDDAVAHAEAASRLRRGDGPARVRQLLRRKGVDQRAADVAVGQAVEEQAFDERAECRRIAERRFTSMHALAPDVAARRLTGFLVRRGYAPPIVRDTVRSLVRSDRRP